MTLNSDIKDFMKSVQANWEALAAPYDFIDRDPDMTLVRLLKYEPKKPKLTSPISNLLMPNEKGDFVEADKAGIKDRILPVVLILKAGESAMEKYDIQDGQLRMVPSAMVVGAVRNPDFIEVHEAHIKNEVVVRTNIPEYLPARIVNWGKLQFVNPFTMAGDEELTNDDVYTFTLPRSFILNKLTL